MDVGSNWLKRWNNKKKKCLECSFVKGRDIFLIISSPISSSHLVYIFLTSFHVLFPSPLSCFIPLPFHDFPTPHSILMLFIPFHLLHLQGHDYFISCEPTSQSWVNKYNYWGQVPPTIESISIILTVTLLPCHWVSF